ncbi:TOMM precursor leader peptide-binding protein [Bacillus mangrovi]|uniref:TOMM leader peptide-binding protein n=1 Tax=Metabacillus mangrovi TaxID=1491830 RepID=A0A7X2V5N0_9BACI|nr:TOMM precursor leader peptide-binding protein [Metabacillus mangrovi]MTH54987.1 TOMM precursor leader peptide-binding protein [Metabacillus mangrovi]
MRTIAVYGEGDLAEAVRKRLSGKYRISREAGQAEAAIVLQDFWNPRFFREAKAGLKDLPRLHAYLSFGEGIIGPAERLGSEGCIHCLSARKLMAGRDRREMWDLTEREAEADSKKDAWASSTGLSQMAILIEQEAEQILAGEEISARAYLLNLKTLAGEWHAFLPDSYCGDCSTIPDDSPELARIRLQSSPKVNGKGYRCRSIEELSGFLVKDYLDDRTGVFNEKILDLTTPFADASVNLPLFGGNEGTAGRTLSYQTSELTAILEGLERYCGMNARGKNTKVRERYRDIKDYAVHPSAFGVHGEEQYAEAGFPFEPFSEDRKRSWVWGYSFLQERPVLVPELLAYYSLGCGHGSGGYVYETSNGCAVGGSMEEAIFHGIMEVAERDSFLMTWYGKLPLRRIDPRSSGDLELNLMLDRLEYVYGYDLLLYQSTMEHGIPCIWAILKNRSSRGMNLMCAAGAHLDPVRAVKSAVFENAGMIGALGEKLEAGREVYVKLLKDSTLVRQMEDHGMLYGLEEAEERLDFLLKDERPLLTFKEAFPAPPSRSDLKEDLEDVLQRFKKRGMDVIAVNQTAPELARNGLHCVKVLIPGMLPMTFGHHLRRLTGLDRVFTVPAELGFTKVPLKPEQLNVYPHPFP